ncbi:MAG: siroheme synthase CysG [Pseudomonadota bacterium]
MDYFPAFLDLNGRPCLVVGGGDIALRKARLLVSAGARLTVVAARVAPAFQAFAAGAGITPIVREFRDSDVDGQMLVVSATGVAAVERTVYDAASAAGVFCNGVDDIANCSYITPAIVDRGSIVVAISSGGAAPVLARKVREQIEALLPGRLGDLAALAKRWRTRVANTLNTLLERRRFWENVFDGPIATKVISGDAVGADADMQRLLNSSHARRGGEAWLVGAGPGDPGLLTLRALQILQQVDVVLHDRLVSTEVLALARRDTDLVSVGKSPGCAANSQEEINELLVSLVASGKRVCRLKGGDPFVFGRGGEEAEALADAGLPYEVVPGITAAAGCAASAGIPLTHRDLSQSVAFVTGHGKHSVDNLDWASLARDRQTLAFYMSVRRFPELMDNLVNNGRAAHTPIAIIENGTRPEQRVLRGTLGQLVLLAEANDVKAPAILIVGEVAGLGQNAIVDRPQTSSIYAKPSIQIAKQG